jgi:hypothetical protein
LKLEEEEEEVPAFRPSSDDGGSKARFSKFQRRGKQRIDDAKEDSEEKSNDKRANNPKRPQSELIT